MCKILELLLRPISLFPYFLDITRHQAMHSVLLHVRPLEARDSDGQNLKHMSLSDMQQIIEIFLYIADSIKGCFGHWEAIVWWSLK